MWSQALISVVAREAAITVSRHRAGLDRPINVSESSELLTRLRAPLTHFAFQYWNKGPDFVNRLLQKACCHCNKLVYFGGKVVCKKKMVQWEAWTHSQVLLLESFPDLLKIKS